jgi:hypothetical protein
MDGWMRCPGRTCLVRAEEGAYGAARSVSERALRDPFFRAYVLVCLHRHFHSAFDSPVAKHHLGALPLSQC